MLLYLILVCVVSAIVPFLSGRIQWETMSKADVVLAMGRAFAHKLQSMGGNLNPPTIQLLNGE